MAQWHANKYTCHPLSSTWDDTAVYAKMMLSSNARPLTDQDEKFVNCQPYLISLLF